MRAPLYFASVLMMSSLAAAETPITKIVPAPVQKVFIPEGYDSNDQVEVYVQGAFPNSCYRLGSARAQINQQEKRIEIIAEAQVTTQMMCLQMIVPFMHTVNLGVLPQGQYEIVVKGQGAWTPQVLNVLEAAIEDQDDYTYLPVEYVTLVGERRDALEVRIEGRYPYTYVGCLTVDRVQIVEQDNDVIIVQPIGRYTDGAECASQNHSKKFDLVEPLPIRSNDAQVLLHARSNGGQSVSNLVSLPKE